MKNWKWQQSLMKIIFLWKKQKSWLMGTILFALLIPWRYGIALENYWDYIYTQEYWIWIVENSNFFSWTIARTFIKSLSTIYYKIFTGISIFFYFILLFKYGENEDVDSYFIIFHFGICCFPIFFESLINMLSFLLVIKWSPDHNKTPSSIEKTLNQPITIQEEIVPNIFIRNPFKFCEFHQKRRKLLINEDFVPEMFSDKEIFMHIPPNQSTDKSPKKVVFYEQKTYDCKCCFILMNVSSGGRSSKWQWEHIDNRKIQRLRRIA